MKKIYSLYLIVLASISVNAQQGFEGKFLLQTENYNKEYKEDAHVTWYIKNGRHRMDYQISGQYSSSYTIVADNNSAKIYSETKGGKTVTPIPLTNSAAVNDYRIMGEEKNQVLNSFNCTKYILMVSDGTIELWLSEQNSISPDIFPAFMQRGYLNIISKLNPKAIPVKILKNDLSGHLAFSQTIIGIIPEKISDSTFIIQ